MQYNAPDTIYHKQVQGFWPLYFNHLQLLLFCGLSRYLMLLLNYNGKARAIQELARKKFQKLRIDIGRSEKELKSERSEKELKSERSEKELKPERFEKELKSERSEKELKPERSEKDLKSEQKMRSNPLVKKQIKKPIFRTAQEPVGSDFSSGATLATMGDVQNGFNATQAGGCERPSNVDGLIIESNPSQIDNNLEKAEELFSGMYKVVIFYNYV